MNQKKVKRPYMDLHFVVEVFNVHTDKLTDAKQIEEEVKTLDLPQSY